MEESDGERLLEGVPAERKLSRRRSPTASVDNDEDEPWMRDLHGPVVTPDRLDAMRNYRLCALFLVLALLIAGIAFALRSTEAPPTPGSSEATVGATAFLATGSTAAVAADNPVCSDLGIAVIQKQNGSAADAAVAVALCQGILSPFASGIGGGAFVLHFNASSATATAYDGRETAPAAATRGLYDKDHFASVRGGTAVGVPGELRALEMLHARHGRLPWSNVVLMGRNVGEGAAVGPMLARRLRQYSADVLASPTLSKVFAKEADNATADGNPDSRFVVKEEGDALEQPQLMETLRAIAERGADAFYGGKVANNIIADVKASHGIMTTDDLKKYTALKREPVMSFYNGRAIYGMPPPSAGGASIAMALNILEGFQLRKIGRNARSFHLIVETLKFAFGQRRDMADPAFDDDVGEVVADMVDKSQAMKLRSKINVSQTFGPGYYADGLSAPPDDKGTSHISIVDADGNSVALTSSLNLGFGAMFLSESTGVILNNQMDDFSTGDVPNSFGLFPAEKNRVHAGKRPVSSMSPTVIVHNDLPYLVVGASGGPRIISSTLQTIVNVMDFGDDLAVAVAAPRLHHQLIPNHVGMESVNNESCAMTSAFDNPVSEAGWPYWSTVCSSFKSLQHVIETAKENGCVQAVKQIFAPTADSPVPRRQLTATSDPRKAGLAAAV